MRYNLLFFAITFICVIAFLPACFLTDFVKPLEFHTGRVVEKKELSVGTGGGGYFFYFPQRIDFRYGFGTGIEADVRFASMSVAGYNYGTGLDIRKSISSSINSVNLGWGGGIFLSSSDEDYSGFYTDLSIIYSLHPSEWLSIYFPLNLLYLQGKWKYYEDEYLYKGEEEGLIFYPAIGVSVAIQRLSLFMEANTPVSIKKKFNDINLFPSIGIGIFYNYSL